MTPTYVIIMTAYARNIYKLIYIISLYDFFLLYIIGSNIFILLLADLMFRVLACILLTNLL